jgi:hypothetical protein
MPISPIRQSNVGTQAGVSTSNCPTAVINGVVAANCHVAIVAAHRLSTAGDLVSAYTTTIGGSPANTWTLARRDAITSAAGHRTELTFWVAANCSAGDTTGKPTLVHNDDSTNVWHHFDEWAGLATSSPLDKVAGATVAAPGLSLTAGPTAALVQAASLQISAAADRFNYAWNGSGAGAGTPPTSHTILQGTTSNTIIAAQSSYRELASTAGVSATWATAETSSHGIVGGTITLKIQTTVRRLRIATLGGVAIAGTTGWAGWIWTADPKDVLGTYKSGGDITVSAGVILVANPPASITTGQTGQCLLENATLTTGLVQWTCEEV